jgi:hypothetical protein
VAQVAGRQQLALPQVPWLFRIRRFATTCSRRGDRFRRNKMQFSSIDTVMPLGAAFFHKPGEAFQRICLRLMLLFYACSSRDPAASRVICHGTRSASHFGSAFTSPMDGNRSFHQKAVSPPHTPNLIFKSKKSVAVTVLLNHAEAPTGASVLQMPVPKNGRHRPRAVGGAQNQC